MPSGPLMQSFKIVGKLSQIQGIILKWIKKKLCGRNQGHSSHKFNEFGTSNWTKADFEEIKHKLGQKLVGWKGTFLQQVRS